MQVAPCIPLGAGGKETYTYHAYEAVPEGTFVTIPFGKQVVEGVVIVSNIRRPKYPTKAIIKHTGRHLTPLQIQFGKWLATAAHGGLGYTLRLFEGAPLQEKVSSTKRKKPASSALIEQGMHARIEQIRKMAGKERGQVLILVPEIHILHAYAGMGEMFHAGLKQSQKKKISTGVADGSIRVIIGTQKALFLPYHNLSLIIIDEEQSDSYKLWDQYPRLHTVRGARVLAHLAGASITYATSYPSLALRFMIQEGTVTPLTDAPTQITSDIIPFTFEDMKFKRPIPDEAASIIRRLAREGKRVFVLYMKKDSAKVEDSLYRNLGARARKNILFGTNALFAKTDPADTDCVAWLLPEFSMRVFEYRSYERVLMIAARLMTYSKKHSLLIATRYPDMARDIIQSSDDVWYKRSLEERSRLKLPPFSDLVRLTIRDKKDTAAYNRALSVRMMLKQSLATIEGTKVLGPFQERGASKKKLVEYHVLVSGPLKSLIPAYKDLPIDAADVDPQKII